MWWREGWQLGACSKLKSGFSKDAGIGIRRACPYSSHMHFPLPPQPPSLPNVHNGVSCSPGCGQEDARPPEGVGLYVIIRRMRLSQVVLKSLSQNPEHEPSLEDRRIGFDNKRLIDTQLPEIINAGTGIWKRRAKYDGSGRCAKPRRENDANRCL